jgi:membrane protein DedA with SNARE-associated domain
MLIDLTEWVTDVIDRLSYLGVALLVALENLFPPIPSEIVLPFAGFVARDGNATLWGMVAAATAGSMAGAWILYGIAAAIGPDRLHAFVARYGKWLRLTNEDIARAERWFDRNAVTAVLVGRCVPLIRSLVSIPAGFRRMSFVTFTVYTLIGSVAWNGALIGAGYGLRHNWDRVEPLIEYAQYFVILVIAAAIGWYVWSRFVSPAGRRRAAAKVARAEEAEAAKSRLG